MRLSDTPLPVRHRASDTDGRPCHRPQALVIRQGEAPAWRFASDVKDVFLVEPPELRTAADCAALGPGEWAELTAAADAGENVAIAFWANVDLGNGEVLSNAPARGGGEQGEPGSLADLWAVQRAVFCPLGAAPWACKSGAKARRTDAHHTLSFRRLAHG